MAPGDGPRDFSAAVQRHRDLPDAGPTQAPPGGWQATVGSNPAAPAVRQASDDSTGDGPAGPGAWSEATAFTPQGADY